jgi:NADPH:quinone reductase
VLIRVRAIGVNPVETYIRSGNYAYTGPWPYTPGHDAAGTVEAVGEGVTRVHPGDRVYTHRTLSGAYAEYALAAEGMVQRLPDRVSFAQGAALPTPYYTAYRALFERLHVRPGRALLVHGATGGVGVAALQLARAHGLTVIGTAGSDAGAALIAPWCHTVLRHGAPGLVEAVLAASPGGKGVHYVLENLANVNLQTDLQVVAPMAGAAICVVGSRGDVSITPRLLMAKEATLTGVMLWGNADDDWTAAAAHIHAGLASGTLAPVLGTVHAGLEAAPAAHEEVISHAGGARGKIIIELP